MCLYLYIILFVIYLYMCVYLCIILFVISIYVCISLYNIICCAGHGVSDYNHTARQMESRLLITITNIRHNIHNNKQTIMLHIFSWVCFTIMPPRNKMRFEICGESDATEDVPNSGNFGIPVTRNFSCDKKFLTVAWNSFL